VSADGGATAALAIQLAVGLLLLGAGAQKLRHWQEFKGIVASYRLLPDSLVTIAALSIASVELLLGVCAILCLARLWVPIAMAALLGVFAAAMAINIGRGRTEIHCGCFRSALRQQLRWRLVVRNLVCAAALLCSYGGSPPTGAVVWGLAVVTSIALLSLYAALDAVWSLDVSRRTALGRV
jgi:hypothetical protein